MRGLASVSIAALLLVAGCSKPAGGSASEHPGADVAVQAAPAALTPAAKAGEKPQAEPPRAGSAAPMLAYAYDYAIEAPTPAVSPLLHRHEAACRAAGPDLCQVVGALNEAVGRDRATGKLQLRAEPRWLEGFRGHLDSDAGAAGGKVIHSATTTEDLTRQIIDTDAAIRARFLLRQRLEQLLATRPGKLSELIELEQELARVQGEIDAAQSEIAVMRTRVAMSAITLQYDSRPPLAAPGALRPLQAAVRAFFGHVAEGLAVVLTLFSYLLPFVLVGAIAWWLIRRLRRRWPARARPAVQTPAPGPAPPNAG